MHKPSALLHFLHYLHLFSPPCPLPLILLLNAVMIRDAGMCKNHPEIEARRKCYQCLSPICPECQKRALGHIFCSAKCQLRCWMDDKARNIRRLWLRLSLRYRRLEKSTHRITGGGLFRLLSICLLLFLLYQTGILINTVENISLSHPATPPQPALPTVDIAHEDEWITVAGSAPDFAVAVLLADGKERDVVTVSEGRYSFTFKADTDTRTFQIQVYGDRLPTMYTRAMPVPNITAPVREEPKAAGSVPSKGTRPETRRPPEQEPGLVAKAPVTAPPPSPDLPAPRDTAAPAHSGDDFSRGVPGTGAVAITFDGGSYSNAAERILDVLEEKGLKTTFFLTGEFVKRYPEVTRRIADEGHEVGNHMYSHLHLTTFGKNYRQDTLPGVNEELVRKELLRNEKAYEELTGKKMVPLWRAPYGEHNEEIRQWALKAGYRHIGWTYDPKTRKSLDGLDWVSDRNSALYLTSDQIVDKILSFDTDTDMGLAGGIVLLHLGSERESDPFHPKLGELIDRLQEKGYKVGSVSELLEKGS